MIKKPSKMPIFHQKSIFSPKKLNGEKKRVKGVILANIYTDDGGIVFSRGLSKKKHHFQRKMVKNGSFPKESLRKT